MILSSNKVKLNPNIDFYFSPSGCVYISGPLGTISNKLSFSFDLISNSSKRSFNNSSIKQLFSLIKFNVFSVTLGYYVFIDLIGLGYKIKKVTTLLYRFYLGQAHYVYVYLPSDVFFWAYQNKITLFSIYADKLFSISTNIMLLRKLNAYKLRGLVRPGQIIVLKEGKQR